MMKERNKDNLSPKILNQCVNRILGLNYYLKKVLNGIGYDKFNGVNEIILVDKRSMCEIEVPTEIKNLLAQNFRLLGYYHKNSSKGLTQIVLFVHEIYRGIPFPLSLTPVSALRLTEAIAHELGHHLINTKKRSYTDEKEESIVNRYEKRILTFLTKKNQYRFWSWCLKELSDWYFALGQADYKSEQLLRAKNNFYTSWQLNKSNEYASEWYWHVMKKLDQN